MVAEGGGGDEGVDELEGMWWYDVDGFECQGKIGERGEGGEVED